MMSTAGVDIAAGAARSRRERRLRSWLKHERMTVAMAWLKRRTKPPHGARGQPEPRPRSTLWSHETSVAGDTEFFSLFEDELGGTRPDRLFEVRPQEWDQRRTMVQIVDSPQVVRSLDVPVPQMENQLVEACRRLDLPIAEQATEVPKIPSSSRRSRRRWVPLVQQTAEQLVEVPAIVSFSFLHGLVEQNVDIPVPHGRGGRDGGGGLQGLRPRQASTASSSHSPGAAD